MSFDPPATISSVHPETDPSQPESESRSAGRHVAPGSWQYRPHFSRIVTVLAALVLIGCVGTVAYIAFTMDGLERVPWPERALSHMVGRTMDLEEATRRTSDWEQTLYRWLMGSEATARAEAIQWYRELAAVSEDPIVDFQLAVLEGESGDRSALRDKTIQWVQQRDPYRWLGKALAVAYLAEPADHAAMMELQAQVADLLPAGWFYDRLASRLAERAGEQILPRSLEQAAADRSNKLFIWSRWLTGFELAAMAGGAVVLIMIWRRRNRDPQWLRYGDSALPPPWPGSFAAHVLLRGGAIGAVLMLSFIFLSAEHAALRMIAVPLTNLPLLMLAQRHLLQPAGLTFNEGFGLKPLPGRASRLWLAVPAIVAAGLFGEWIMGRIAEPLNLSSHWTEWFDADLVWAPAPILSLSLLEYVVFAPVFEEIAFRGLLFGLLRRRFALAPAAVISAGIFGLAHGYGVLGFASVFWSGLVWAWAYERTGSLVPGMVAHGINNLLVCLAVIALLRS
jgi:membrane protease YdiL (CAAX protease family)